MPQRIDITGKQYNDLTVLSFSHSVKKVNGGSRSFWNCICVCGKDHIVDGAGLKNGNTTNCGCKRKAMLVHRNKHILSSHKKSKKRIYQTWSSMKARCFNENLESYKNYGGRGISICSDWLDFNLFYSWAIKNGYNDSLTIERIDVNGDYAPYNCTFVTSAKQQINKRNNCYITAWDETKAMSAWLVDSRCVVSRSTLKYRLKLNWQPEKALTTPMTR